MRAQLWWDTIGCVGMQTRRIPFCLASHVSEGLARGAAACSYPLSLTNTRVVVCVPRRRAIHVNSVKTLRGDSLHNTITAQSCLRARWHL